MLEICEMLSVAYVLEYTTKNYVFCLPSYWAMIIWILEQFYLESVQVKQHNLLKSQH